MGARYDSTLMRSRTPKPSHKGASKKKAKSPTKRAGRSSKLATQNKRRSAGKRAVFPPPEEFDRAIANAVREAVLRHKRLGQSVVTWKDGRVVEVPARKIRVPRKR